MPLPVLAKLGLAAAGGGLLWWMLAGSSGAAAGDAAAATAAGTQAGCDLGTKDAKQGLPEDLNPVDDSVRGLAAKYGSAAPAYISAFESAYSSCWTKNAPPPPVTKVDVPPPAKAPPPVAKAYLDRFGALGSYLDGARQGARDGYKDGIAKTEDAYDPTSYGSGTYAPKAFRAGYGCGYGTGKSYAKTFDGKSSILTPDYLPKEQENNIVDGVCSPTFGAWYDLHKGDASVAGVAGVGSLRVGNLALVGARRSPVDVDTMHADMGRHFMPSASKKHGWPAPPDDVDATSTLYRSY